MGGLKSIFTVKNNKELILNGKISKALIMLAVPIIITNFLQSMYNLTDTFWLGKIGTIPQAAISLVSPVQSTVMSFGQGITMAGSILISQYIGAGDEKNGKGMANQIFLCSMIFSIVCAAVLCAASPLIIGWMGADAELMAPSNTYLRIVVLDMPLLFIMNIYSAVNQAQGNTISPMLVNFLGIFINMFLDPLLMFGLDMGIAGAALATLGAKIPCAAIGLISLLNKKNYIHLDLKSMRPDWKKIKKIITVGFPTAVGNSAMQFGFVLMSKNVYVFGAEAMAAYGVGNKINSVVTLPANALGSATSTIVGQNLGAGQLDRAERGYKYARNFAVVFLFVLGMILAREPVATLMVNIFTSDDAVVPMAVDFIAIMATWCFTNGVYNCTIGLLNGSGKTKATMLVEAARLWVFRFATIFFCENILHMGVESIWYSVVVSNGISAAVLYVLYRLRGWEKDTLGIRKVKTAK